MTHNSIEGMTRGELRAMIREVLIEVLQELGAQPDDPDFRPEIAARLRTFMSQRPAGQPVEDVARELGLDV